MGNIEMADRQAVADIGPGCFADQFEADTFLGGKAQFFRRHQNGAVEQRNETRADHRHVLAATFAALLRSEEHTSELQSLMRISYAVFSIKQKSLTTRGKHIDSTTQTILKPFTNKYTTKE